MAASKQQHSLLHLISPCDKSELIAHCYAPKKRTEDVHLQFSFCPSMHRLFWFLQVIFRYLSYHLLSFPQFLIFPLQTLEIIYLQIKFYFFLNSYIYQRLCRHSALSTYFFSILVPNFCFIALSLNSVHLPIYKFLCTFSLIKFFVAQLSCLHNSSLCTFSTQNRLDYYQK